MAESVVTFFLEKLSLLISHEARLLLGVNEQVRSLRGELQLIKSFLKYADEKRKMNEMVDVWVSQVRDLAYEAEDVIDAFILKVEQQRQRNTLCKYIYYRNQLISVHHVGTKIEEINRRIQKIFVDKSNYEINISEAGPSSISPDESFRTRKERRDSTVEEVAVVGFQKDAEKLAAQLIQGDRRRLVVSIVGMGGLGKTTLAKKVYNRSDIKKHFHTCAWIYVSQENRASDLLQKIITQVGSLKTELKNEEDFRNNLREYLQEKRYLVVVDDIWDEEAWDKIKEAFPTTMDGSRIMLTTRNKNVALHADPLIVPHELSLLDKTESWELFSKKVFLGENTVTSFPSYLKEVGEKIVAKCGGLPLAIIVLGGLISVKDKTPTIWSKVLDSVKWQLTQESNPCMEVLALSYNDLPYYLKSCFLYLGLYPEDFEINAEKLILLWVAEGFIQPRGDEKMEDVAEDCLEELIQRSMIQVAQRRSDGGVLSCRIHDLLRDLAISEGKKDRFLDAYGTNYFASAVVKSRRLAIHPCDDEYQYHSNSTLNLRSLLFFTERFEKAIKSKSFYGDIKLLRVLDLEGVDMSEKGLPKEIGELILLNYLGLRDTSIQSLPSCIGKLGKLQILDLRKTMIKGIPKAIWKMKQLRHLFGLTYDNVQLNDLSSSPKGVTPTGELPRDLLTLELPTGSWIEGGLGKLSNLRQLVVHGVGVRDSDALSNAIVKLQCLRSLVLVTDCLGFQWIPSYNDIRTVIRRNYQNSTQLPLLEITQHQQLYQLKLHGWLQNQPNNPLRYFPTNLTELHLSYSCLEQDPIVTLEKLPNLKVLFLGHESYRGKVMICSADGFPRLQLLRLERLNSLEEWRVEVGGMLRLKDLIIGQCDSLKMLPDELRHITTLQKIKFHRMPYTFSDRVKENGEDWEKIKHVPSITTRELVRVDVDVDVRG